jgi:hypothetical protein
MGRRALFGKPMTKAEIQARWRARVRRRMAEKAEAGSDKTETQTASIEAVSDGRPTAPWTAHQERILEALVRVGAVRPYVLAEDGRLRFEAVEMPEEALQQALHAAVDTLRAEDRALR